MSNRRPTFIVLCNRKFPNICKHWYDWLQSSASPTPKATPLQSPGVEVVSSELNTCTVADEEIITTVRTVTTVTSGEEEETIETVHSEKVEVTVVSPPVEKDITPEVKQEIVVQTTIKESTPVPVKEIQESVNDTPECDMTGMYLNLCF